MNSLSINIRREFWEHASLWRAPAIWAGILIVMSSWLIFVIIPHNIDHAVSMGPDAATMSQLSERDRKHVTEAIAKATEEAKQHPREHEEKFFAFSYLAITSFVQLFTCVVVFFYLIDCLYTERRDRSILFWKSLPLSDERVVLSKLAVALVVVPLGTIALAAALQLILMALLWLRFHGTMFAAALPDLNLVAWGKSQLLALGITMAGVAWYAPIAGYLLVMSSWARRNAFLWVVLPPVSLMAIEGFFFHSSNVAQFIGWRLIGFVPALRVDPAALNISTHDSAVAVPRVDDVFSAFDLSGVFLNWSTWAGIAVAAALVFAAIRMRRYRDDS